MSGSRWERFAPLTGVVFVVLIALILFVFDNNTPDADDSTADVVNYWTSHTGKAQAAGLIGAFAVIFLVWFGGSLRSALRRVEGGEGRLATLAFAGILLVAVGGGIEASFDFTLGDIAKDVDPSTVAAISALDEDFFLLFPAGIIVLMVASGLCTLRFGALPRWLGWAALLIALASVTPAGFVAFFAAFIWILIVSIALFQRGDETATPAAPPPAAPAA